jgi:hypothetical protein
MTRRRLIARRLADLIFQPLADLLVAPLFWGVRTKGGKTP